ncbi:tetratricopeptide repeat protein [Streptomyces sp. NPDC047072]|uniref:tetratricopeptide repeat protein n=1 Tax=Streptomyces sp. NPDC047072 TaxID=3154809 RepID=UPI0033FD1163
MGPRRPSLQELIERRKRAGFVGRRGELDRFRANFDTAPEDERHSFVFHVHGTAGVGKSSLVRELDAVAVGRGALTATTDETVNSVPEAMAAISAQFARQGAELKALDKLLATYRQRRHEAESASAVLQADSGLSAPPSAGSMAVAQAGLIGLGMVPGVGAFAGAIDPTQVAHGTDRLRSALSARFRNDDDVQLVLEPLKALTPVFVTELDRAAAEVPWITLFFDTYERTAPFLDAWLLDLLTTDHHGALPPNVIVTLAGQHGPDPTRWADYAGFVTEIPLEPFTESEVRQLLAAKGVSGEEVVREVLRLSGGLPVLVTTLAANPGAVDDPAATAVERFLRWEQDPARRAVALACSFPRRLDEDVFGATAEGEATDSGADGGATGSYSWLRGLPFVSERAGRVRYHDVVRAAMLRMQRTRSPQRWAQRHTALAGAYGRWRAAAEDGLAADELWADERWRDLRTEEAYHLLCANPRAALGQVLADFVAACRADVVAARGCAQALYEAGEQTGAEEVRNWGHQLLGALSKDSHAVFAALGLLLDRAALDAPVRAEAHSVRGRELRQAKDYVQALVECERAVALDPGSARAYHGRGVTHGWLEDHAASLADLDRADELRPDTPWIIAERGEALQGLGRHEEAVAAFDRALVLDPTDDVTWANKAYSRHALGDHDGALADFGRALEIDEEYRWALVHRAEVYRTLGRHDEAFADLDRAVELAPDSAWIASERGDAYRLAGRYEEAAEELGRTCALAPDYASAYASRGYALAQLNRLEEARAAYDRAIELVPDYAWALAHRARLREELGDQEGRLADLRSAVAASPETVWIGIDLGDAYRIAGRHREAIDAFHRVLEREPDSASALAILGACHRDLGAYAEALRCLDRALATSDDYGWAYGQRAGVRLATGRAEEALADWDRCVALGQDVNNSRRRAVEALMYCDRWDEALARLAAVEPTELPEGYLDFLSAEALRHTGRWAQARRFAERVRARDLMPGVYQMALIGGRTKGLRAAEPLWRELARALDGYEGDPGARMMGGCMIGWAVADWAAGDRRLAGLLSLEPDWEDLADLADTLTELLHSPDADRPRLAPRLTAVTRARDAVRARFS